MAGLGPVFDPRFVVISPRAPLEIEPFAYAWFHETFHPDGPVADAGEERTAFERFAGFLDAAVPAVGSDPSRTWLMGFSQGSMVALATMLMRPDDVAGVVCMSGRLPPEVVAMTPESASLQGKPVLIVHGSRDQTIPIELGRRAAADLRELGLDVTTVELDVGHTTSDEGLRAVSAWLSRQLGT
jgi:phospholipase/carboxylesterase